MKIILACVRCDMTCRPSPRKRPIRPVMYARSLSAVCASTRSRRFSPEFVRTGQPWMELKALPAKSNICQYKIERFQYKIRTFQYKINVFTGEDRALVEGLHGGRICQVDPVATAARVVRRRVSHVAGTTNWGTCSASTRQL